MAGHMIAAYLEEQNYEVYRAARRQEESNRSSFLDVFDLENVIELLHVVKPDIIVNAIGALVKQGNEDPSGAIYLNAFFPRWLERYCANTDAKLIHLSTDCVFSGTKGNYKEDDFRDGDTVYDRSKALGEVRNKKDLTFRMSIIGPDPNENGVGLFHWFMQQSGKIKGFRQVLWNGITTLELAKGIEVAIKENLTGLYHLVPEQNIDKYSLLKLFASMFDRDNITIVPVDKPLLNKTLICTRTDFSYKPKTYLKQASDMKRWIESHKELYTY